MRKLPIVLVPLLLLALVISGCGGGGEALSPEAKEISDFLNDKHVNAVVWEEWNIFDEWSYAVSVYDRGYSGKEYQPIEDFEKLRHLKQALRDRAVENHRELLAVSPPQSLEHFWSEVTKAMHWFYSYVTVYGSPATRGALDRAYRNHADVWLELRGICREHHITLEWPLPRVLPPLQPLVPIPL